MGTQHAGAPPRLCLAVGLCALAALLLELALTRIFSVVLFYHYAFMAISTALFGLGAGGVLAYWIEAGGKGAERLWPKLGRLATMNALCTLLALWIVLQRPLTFGMTWQGALVLAMVYLVCAFPFLLAGVVISLSISNTIRDVSKVYFSDLLGAATGCLLLIPLLDRAGGPGAVMMAGALFALAGAAWHSIDGWNRRATISTAIAALLAAMALLNPSSGFIDVKYAKGQSLPAEEFSKWNSFSRISVGPDSRSDRSLILIDSDAGTEISDADIDALTPVQREAMLSQGPGLPYFVRPGAKTLVIGAGGGMDVARALASGSRDVTAVEINPLIVDGVMRQAYAKQSRGLYFRDDVRVVIEDGRTFVRRTGESFQVIQMTLVDSWASTAAGAFALAENHLYTTEAFVDYLEHLSDDGMIAITRWEFSEPRESLRVVSVARAALLRIRAAQPARHIIVAREDVDRIDNWGAKDTILIKRTPFTDEELAVAHQAVKSIGMAEVYFPDLALANPFTALLTSPDPDAYIASYPFQIWPTTDNRPFFFYTVPLGSLWSFVTSPWHVDSKINLGVMLLVAALVMSILGTVTILALPRLLLKQKVPSGPRLWIHLLYFFAIGVAFILVEISLVQRIVFFLGQPTYALTVVIFSMLLSSSFGSFVSRRVIAGDDRRLSILLLGVVSSVAMLVLVAPGVMDATLSQPLSLKLAVLAAMIFPAGFLMGMPFPSGLRRLEAVFPNAVCWAWAVNSAASVLGSVGAVFLGIHLGLAQTAMIGGALYIGALAAVRLTASRLEQEQLDSEAPVAADLENMCVQLAAEGPRVQQEEAKPSL